MVGIGVTPALRPRLEELAAGRVLVIDYFTTRRCSVTLGDLTARFRTGSPGPGFSEIIGPAGTRTFARDRLLPVLAASSVTLCSRLAGRLGLEMEPASAWIDFLEDRPPFG